MRLALIILFFINALIHLYACFFSYNVLRRVTKPLILPLLAAIYCVLAPKLNAFVLIGLMMGLAGDILLLFAPKNHACFMAGACCFAAGHAAYIVALFTGTALQTLALSAALPAALPFAAAFLAALALVYTALFPYLSRNKRILMPIYLLLICVFGALAGAGAVKLVQGGFFCMLIGAALFLTSDSILSFQSFKKATKRGSCRVMFTYILAQALITLGFIII